MSDNFSLPDLSWPVAVPFWKSCQEENIKFQYCPKCQAWQWYPLFECAECGGEFEWRDVTGKATLFSWTTVYKAFLPGFENKIPLIVAVADVEGAPGVRLISNIINAKPEELKVGMELKIVYEHVDEEHTMPRFEAVK